MSDESEERLREILHELRDQLEATDAVDTELSVTLRTAIDDVQRSLEPSGESPTAQHPLVERLSKLALRFEAEHPVLADAINKLTNELASMGI